jgi:two-component system, OmpR family, sensor histidine kinase QseC
MSIRRFLLIGLLGALLISFIVIFLFNRYQTLIEIGELYDTQLAQTSRILQGFIDRPANEIDFKHLNNALLTVTENYINDEEHDKNKMRNNEGHEYEHKFAVQIWDNSANLLVKSPAAPLYAISTFQDGYSIIKIGEFEWNVFTHHLIANGYWVLVAERTDIRDEIIDELTFSSLIGPIIGMFLLALGVIFIVTRGLKPLTDLSQQIGERHIDKLEPLTLEHIPKELKPLGQAVNVLMERVSEGVERERRFLGDVAHELRTPLTSIKLNAQNGLHASDDLHAQHFLEKIVLGVDRSTRLIEQLLTLARLDPRALGEREPCNLGEISQEVISVMSYQKYLNNIKLHKSLYSVTLLAFPDLIGVMLRNLIENACRHSPEDKEIILRAINNDDLTITFSIIDQGPGVSNLQLQSLGQRFFRERPADRMGSGLGLSIVARIAELHGARLSFENASPSGLIVSMIFTAISLKK